MQITYQKRDGSIFQRIRKKMIPYQIGDTTSMGWKVLNIEYKYKDKYYQVYQYYMLISKDRERYKKKQQIIKYCIKSTKSLLYYIVGIYIINLINILLG